MQSTSVLALLTITGLALAAEDKVRTLRFAKEDAGKLPAGWKAEKTGTGEGSIWKVVEDDTAPSKTGYGLSPTRRPRFPCQSAQLLRQFSNSLPQAFWPGRSSLERKPRPIA